MHSQAVGDKKTSGASRRTQALVLAPITRYIVKLSPPNIWLIIYHVRVVMTPTFMLNCNQQLLDRKNSQELSLK